MRQDLPLHDVLPTSCMVKEGSLQGVGANEEERTARDEEGFNCGPLVWSDFRLLTTGYPWRSKTCSGSISDGNGVGKYL